MMSTRIGGAMSLTFYIIVILGLPRCNIIFIMECSNLVECDSTPLWFVLTSAAMHPLTCWCDVTDLCNIVLLCKSTSLQYHWLELGHLSVLSIHDGKSEGGESTVRPAAVNLLSHIGSDVSHRIHSHKAGGWESTSRLGRSWGEIG